MNYRIISLYPQMNAKPFQVQYCATNEMKKVISLKFFALPNENRKHVTTKFYHVTSNVDWSAVEKGYFKVPYPFSHKNLFLGEYIRLP
jgi:hypothetical protein